MMEKEEVVARGNVLERVKEEGGKDSVSLK